ncbi:winged helix-turn-helix transcriptional regulator [Frankia nepalensis]|uniref:winged helix-turn-helix transcriptional regulator n=1 Tax=Frankia nepalensis TaxID=1836974 RepID=UPI00288B50F1|nr:helix-turn-helix domain-containing protein [Frankia nepalensis]
MLNHLTSRWGLLVLVALRDGPMRFYELRNLVDGVSEKMLSQTLRTLTRDGLLAREVMATSPPSVRYALTPLGVDAAEPLQQVLQWVRRNATTVCRSQESYDEQNHGDA